MRTYRELKIRLDSEEAGLQKLAPFIGDVKPTTQKMVDTYLRVPENTLKISEVDGKLFKVEVLRDPQGFKMYELEITKEEKQNLLNKFKVKIVLRKIRKVWEYLVSKIDFIEIAIDHVEGLGYFLEIQGEKKRLVIDFFQKLGYNERNLLTKSYDQLIFR